MGGGKRDSANGSDTPEHAIHFSVNHIRRSLHLLSLEEAGPVTKWMRSDWRHCMAATRLNNALRTVRKTKNGSHHPISPSPKMRYHNRGCVSRAGTGQFFA